MAKQNGADFDINRTFGVEIECYMPDGVNHRELAQKLQQATGIPITFEGYTHGHVHAWKVVTDGSLDRSRGAEIVSPVLAGEPGLEQVRRMALAADELGCTVNRDCGLHVHHGVHDYDLDDMKKLAQLYVKMEGAIDLIMPPSRRSRNSRWCQSHRGGGDPLESTRDSMQRISEQTSVGGVCEVLSYGSRYAKLNATGFDRRGTVEFRQHSGTVNAEKIINWVQLTQAMVDESKRAQFWRVTGMDNFTLLMKFCNSKSVKKFYRSRVRELNSNRH